MKWMMVVIAFGLLTSCLTAGVPDHKYLSQQLSQQVALDLTTCGGKCEKGREDCMNRLSQFWQQCEADYDMCLEYCY